MYMPNERKIKAKITELGLTIGGIAKKIGVSPYTLGRKIAVKTPMSIREARLLQKELQISDQDDAAYFLLIELRFVQQKSEVRNNARKRNHKKLLVNLAETYNRTSYPLRLEIADRMIEVYKVLSEDSSDGGQ